MAVRVLLDVGREDGRQLEELGSVSQSQHIFLNSLGVKS